MNNRIPKCSSLNIDIRNLISESEGLEKRLIDYYSIHLPMANDMNINITNRPFLKEQIKAIIIDKIIFHPK